MSKPNGKRTTAQARLPIEVTQLSLLTTHVFRWYLPSLPSYQWCLRPLATFPVRSAIEKPPGDFGRVRRMPKLRIRDGQRIDQYSVQQSSARNGSLCQTERMQRCEAQHLVTVSAHPDGKTVPSIHGEFQILTHRAVSRELLSHGLPAQSHTFHSRGALPIAATCSCHPWVTDQCIARLTGFWVCPCLSSHQCSN